MTTENTEATLDGVEQAASDLCCVIDVTNLLMEEQQGNDRFPTMCVIYSELKRILESLNGVSGGTIKARAPAEAEPPKMSREWMIADLARGIIDSANAVKASDDESGVKLVGIEYAAETIRSMVSEPSASKLAT